MRPEPARRRHRERQVGQSAGDPRRRLPAVTRVGHRRVARYRDRRIAGRHDRLAVRGPDRGAPPHLRHHRAPRRATSPRSRARRHRCSERRPASAASSPAPTAGSIERSPSTATRSASCSRSSTTSSTSPRRRISSASPPGTTWSRASTRCRCCGRSRSGVRSPRSSAICSASRSKSVERDKALAIVRSNEGVESAVATARQYVDAAEAVCDRFPAGTATDALRAAPAALLGTVYTRSAG